MNRGPRDHPEAIIYMSRATPRKKEKGGRLVRLTAGRARVRPPLCPPGPWPRRSRWSRWRRRPLSTASCAVASFGRRVSGFSGRAGSPRRDRLPRWSRHRLRRDTGGGAPWLTSGSMSVESDGARPQPVGVSRRRMPHRSWFWESPATSPRRRLPPWFQVRPSQVVFAVPWSLARNGRLRQRE